MVPMMRDLFIGGHGSELTDRVIPISSLRLLSIIGPRRLNTRIGGICREEEGRTAQSS